MISCRRALIAVIAAVSAVISAAGPEAATLTVRRYGVGQFDRIQPAIDAAAPGDTIDIGPGEYAEYTPLRIDGSFQVTNVYVSITVDNLTIIGAGSDRTSIGPADDSPVYGPHKPVVIWARDLDRIHVRSLTIRHGQTGIHGSEIETAVRDCKFVGNAVGVRVQSGRVEIDDCVFEGFDWASSAARPVPYQMEGLETDDFVLPFALGVTHLAACESSRVSECRFIRAGLSLSGVEDYLVQDCQFEDVRYALSIHDDCEGLISRCAIACASNNAVYIEASPCVMNSVEIVGGQGGINLTNGRLIADGLTIRDTTHRAIALWSNSEISVHNSNFLPRSGFAVELAAGLTPPSRTHDMTGNYWGVDDSAAIAELIWDRHDSSLIDDEIDYEPFQPTVATERKSLGAVKAGFR